MLRRVSEITGRRCGGAFMFDSGHYWQSDTATATTSRVIDGATVGAADERVVILDAALMLVVPGPAKQHEATQILSLE